VGNWLYFKDDEVRGLSPDLVAMLDRARHVGGAPFVLTSTVRTSDENAAAGGAKDSAHLKGLGVDIHARSSSERFAILAGLFTAGFKRIGLYDLHIHADIDGSLPQFVFWTGKSK
jgi:hypothetical protein